MLARWVWAVVLCGGLLAVRVAAAEDPSVAIRAALAAWTADFNARRGARICDMFTDDLRYDYRGFPERDRAAICKLLQRSLADETRRYAYALDVREVIVAGDLAVVRLTWTLSISGAGVTGTMRSVEPGMDIFRRGADGTWRIARYIAYEE